MRLPPRPLAARPSHPTVSGQQRARAGRLGAITAALLWTACCAFACTTEQDGGDQPPAEGASGSDGGSTSSGKGGTGAAKAGAGGSSKLQAGNGGTSSLGGGSSKGGAAGKGGTAGKGGSGGGGGIAGKGGSAGKGGGGGASGGTASAGAGGASTPCGGGEVFCAGVCASLQYDDDNCGACGNACGAGQYCKLGKCACFGGKLACGGSCIEPTKDPQNCGACGNVCVGTGKCTGGNCETCPSGTKTCPGACAYIDNDPKNCGGCGNVCSAPEACVKGTCRAIDVLIPGGTYSMGTNGVADGGGDEEAPPHAVTVSTFYLDTYEVTVDAYQACVVAGKCTLPWQNFQCNWYMGNMAQHPVNCVTWSQATKYCEWMGRRLPTEEEWELAARGKSGRKYPWGPSEPGNRACWYEDEPGRNGTCGVGTHPSGKTPEGVHDLAGNVAEWTSSGWSEDYSQARGTDQRVVRGAGYAETDARYLRGAARSREVPGILHPLMGFRCARDL